MGRRGGFTAASKGTDKSSGLGLTASLGTVGGVEVSAVVDVDISPLSADINYDASENDLSVKGEIGLPGGVVSVGGGTIIDLDTGEVIGGSGSLGFGGAEVEVSVTKCERTLQVTYWGLGFAVSENTCDPGEDPDPDPAIPPPRPSPNPSPSPSSFPDAQGFVMFANNSQTRWRAYLSDFDKGILSGEGELSKNSYSYGFPDVYRPPSTSYGEDGSAITVTQTYSYKIWGSGYCVDGKTPLEDSSSGVLLSSHYLENLRRNRFNSPTYSFDGLSFRYLLEPGSSSPPGTTPDDQNHAFYYYVLYYASNVKKLMEYLAQNNVWVWTRYFENFSTGGVKYGSSGCADGALEIAIDEYSYAGWFPTEPIPSNNRNINTNKRRPIPTEDMTKNQNECCEASVSLLRKIAKVLAVDQLLEEDEKKKVSTETVDKFKIEYDKLAAKLALLNKKPKIVFENYVQFQIYELAIGNKKIDEIHTVLRAEDLLNKGMEIPNELIVPTGSGVSIVKDYPNILKKFIQIMDLNTIQPFTAVLQDSDPAKEGNQPLTKFYPDATSAIKEIIELMMENKVDAATRLNIQIRQSILATQTQVALLETLSIAYTILYGLGLPFHQKGSSFVAPFDVSPDPKGKDESKKKAKGFNPKNKEEEKKLQSAINSLNENREASTEKLLPDFLTTVKQEYLHTYFNDAHESMWYYVMSVLMKV